MARVTGHAGVGDVVLPFAVDVHGHLQHAPRDDLRVELIGRKRLAIGMAIGTALAGATQAVISVIRRMNSVAVDILQNLDVFEMTVPPSAPKAPAGPCIAAIDYRLACAASCAGL